MTSLRQILISVGFPSSLVDTMLGIAKAESGGNPLAIHNNALPNYPSYRSGVSAGASPEFSVGLFQINLSPATGRMDASTGKLTKGPLAGQDWSVLLDPVNNAKYALAISGGGLQNWSTYYSGISGPDIMVQETDPNWLANAGKFLNNALNPIANVLDAGKQISGVVNNTVSDTTTKIQTEVEKSVMTGVFGALGLGLILLGFYFIARPFIGTVSSAATKVATTVAK